MNAISFGAAIRGRANPDETRPDKPLDAAWIVLDAANDLEDEATIAACRRVIDAGLNGLPASPSDLHIILDYFR
jgi:hypothetical protein